MKNLSPEEVQQKSSTVITPKLLHYFFNSISRQLSGLQGDARERFLAALKNRDATLSNAIRVELLNGTSNRYVLEHKEVAIIQNVDGVVIDVVAMLSEAFADELATETK